MSRLPVPAKLAGFLAALAVLFGLGAAAGAVLETDAPGRGDAPAGERHRDTMTADAAAVRGLGVTEHGLRLALDTPELTPGRQATVRLRILDARDRVVRDFDVEHARRMHLIVVRRDATNFQHLHPVQGADGSWSVPVTVTEPGSYRVFADFHAGGRATTLATDLRVDGAADLAPLPAPARSAVSDGGYRVRLAGGTPRAGREADLRFTVTTRDGRAVRTEPYLGAGGHLVALREGDLAFLHVHPGDHAAGAPITFGSTFPSPGRYRLFLQFQVAGTVQTVAFTQEVTR